MQSPRKSDIQSTRRIWTGNRRQGVSNKNKNILSGGPEGTINSKQINNIPDADDDVEGHVYKKSIT